MIKYDAAHPDGILVPPDQPANLVMSPVTVRQMTEEEREQYGKPQKRRRGETVCPWTKRQSSIYRLGEFEDAISSGELAPVVHGEWVGKCGATCNLCGYIDVAAYIGRKPNYCPNCNAKMDGKDGDEK